MALFQQTVQKNNRYTRKKRNRLNYALYVWAFLMIMIVIACGYVGFASYSRYIDPARVYGEWTEIGAPSWSTDRFVLSDQGVISRSRFVSTTFDFNGSVVSFSRGNERIEYRLVGNNSERLTRISGGGHSTSFIKKGYEHTLPPQDNVGPARRVSLAEHFKSKQ